MTVTGGASGATVSGLATTVSVSNGETALDIVQVNGLAGDDAMNASGMAAGAIGVTFEGGDGVDAVEAIGDDGAEIFTTTANGLRVRFDRLTPAPFFLDIGTVETLIVKANGGDDSFAATGNLAALIKLTVDGGAGNDTILGSNGVDLLLGGDGNDFIDGQQGNDTAFLGDGDDTFQWDPGDGSDVVEGQAGMDRLLFNGSGGSEVIDVSANGPRARFTRNLGNIALDLDDVERIDVNALGSPDTITVNDMTGTDVTAVGLNLAGVFGGGAGDAQADSVIVNATNGNDTMTVTGGAGGATVSGLAATISISAAEATLDTLRINALAGADSVDASGLPAGVLMLTVDGGDGNDTLTGSDGDDVILGGEGDDVLQGGPGNDTLDGGPGNNVVTQ